MSPVLGRPPRALRSRPVKPGARAPGAGKGTTASGKPTGAPRATEPDEARRPRAGPGGTPERHAAGLKHSTGPGDKQQRPPGAANPDSAHHTHTTTALETVPSNTQPGVRRPPRSTPAARGHEEPEEKQRESENSAGPRRSSEPEKRRRSVRETGRPGLEHPGRTKQEEPHLPDWNVQGQEAAGSLGLDHAGRNTQEEPLPPGLEQPGESGGQKRRRQVAETEELR